MQIGFENYARTNIHTNTCILLVTNYLCSFRVLKRARYAVSPVIPSPFITHMVTRLLHKLQIFSPFKRQMSYVTNSSLELTKTICTRIGRLSDDVINTRRPTNQWQPQASLTIYLVFELYEINPCIANGGIIFISKSLRRLVCNLSRMEC